MRFPFLDFSTTEQRRAACLAELAVNRRTAPGLYIGVAPIRFEAGRLKLGHVGEATADAVDWVVVMHRFDEATLFDRLAERGALAEGLVVTLADEIATFHREAQPVPGAGGARAMRSVLDESLDELAACRDLLDADLVDRVTMRSREALDAVAGLLDRRAAEGKVRRCHGDLHLRNICLIDGRPTLFDAIEFSDALAVIDVLYDLAFLVMDLLHRDLGALANRVLNRYLEVADEMDGLAAFPVALTMRAIVRAKIAALLARDAADTAQRDRLHEARAYLELALACTTLVPPVLVAVGGLSGTGKSTVARGLAPLLGRPPGAVVIRSDVVRKQLAGVALETRLAADAYGPESAESVYREMRRRADVVLTAGQSAVLDAVHANPGERAAARALAAERGVAFQGLWLVGDIATLSERVAGRRNDASDATPAVLQQQLSYETGAVDWERLEAAGEPEAVLARARAALGPLTRTG